MGVGRAARISPFGGPAQRDRGLGTQGIMAYRQGQDSREQQTSRAGSRVSTPVIRVAPKWLELSE